jgi:hypothetical protein
MKRKYKCTNMSKKSAQICHKLFFGFKISSNPILEKISVLSYFNLFHNLNICVLSFYQIKILKMYQDSDAQVVATWAF